MIPIEYNNIYIALLPDGYRLAVAKQSEIAIETLSTIFKYGPYLSLEDAYKRADQIDSELPPIPNNTARFVEFIGDFSDVIVEVSGNAK